MKPRTKIIITLITLIFLGGVSYALYIWNMPHPKVENEHGIEITASALFDSFKNNESSAGNMYINKAIQVTGVVFETKKNQVGNTVVILQSTDPFYGVNCTFKEDPGPIQKGSTITFKGFCTGYLGDNKANETGDVIINEGIIVKK
jgi:tRNA_anti-like